MEFIFHIGQQKAASSTIQQFLAQNRESLLRRGVMYPSAFGAGVSRLIIDYVTGGPEPDSKREYLLNILQKELAAGQSRTIFSYENLFNAGVATQLKAAFAPYAKTWRILCYLRRPDEHSVSLYQENVKGGYCGTLDAFIEDQLQGSYYNYADTMDQWAAVFGKDAVEVRLFHRAALKGSLIEDFSGWIGVDPQTMRFEAENHFNESLDPTNVEILRFLNLCFLEQPEMIQRHDMARLRARLRSMDTGERLRLDATRAARLQEHFRADHERLAERYLSAGHASILLARPAEMRSMHALDRDALEQRMMSLFDDSDLARLAVEKAEQPAGSRWAPKGHLRAGEKDQVDRLKRWQDKAAKKASRLAAMNPDKRAKVEDRKMEKKQKKREERLGR